MKNANDLQDSNMSCPFFSFRGMSLNPIENLLSLPYPKESRCMQKHEKGFESGDKVGK